jgi:hypothetical protein
MSEVFTLRRSKLFKIPFNVSEIICAFNETSLRTALAPSTMNHKKRKNFAGAATE